MAKAKKTNGKAKAVRGARKPKTSISFKTWATTLARGRGDKAAKELGEIRANPKLAADSFKFPVLEANYNKYRMRGSQASA